MSCTSCCFDAARRPEAASPGNLAELAALLRGSCPDCPQALAFLRNLPPELQASLTRAYVEDARPRAA
jgi:hypothetical protein